MRRNRLFIGTVIAILFATSASAPISTVRAANADSVTASATSVTPELTSYTTAEKNAVTAYQQQYASLANTNDTITSLFQTDPDFSATFSPGTLKTTVIEKTVSWINYYRTLVGLPNVIENTDSDTLAQISSAVMAYAQSDPYKDQHDLANTTKPINLPDLYWYRAVLGTDQSNLYFGFPTTIGEPIHDLILDNTNISGLDAGHRAWFLSPYLSTVGVGIAKSEAGRTYESVIVKNNPDRDRTPASDVVTYPGNGVFPVEELTDSKGLTATVPWSISFSKLANIVTDNTSITVTNLTEGTTGTTEPIAKDSAAFSSTVLSFTAPANVTINDHSQYQVVVSGLNSETMPSYTYTFKTFSEKGDGVNGTVTD